MNSHDVAAMQHFSPADGRERGRPKRSLIDWPAGQELQGHTVRAAHHLLDTNLFSDAKLVELFDEHDPDELLVYRMGDNHHKLDDFQYGSRGKLTAAQLLEAVKDGKLWLSLVNLDPAKAKDVAVNLSGVRVSRAAGQVLTGPNVNSVNTFDAPETVSPRAIQGRVSNGRVTVSLPAKSVAVLALD